MIEDERTEESRIISEIRLRVGGAAILAADRRNQAIDIAGKSVKRPLVKKMLRVWVVS